MECVLFTQSCHFKESAVNPHTERDFEMNSQYSFKKSLLRNASTMMTRPDSSSALPAAAIVEGSGAGVGVD